MAGFLSRRPGLSPNEAILEAHIDYSDSRELTQEDSRIEATVVRTLTTDLPRDLERFFDLHVSIRIKGTRYGSLSVFFGVMVAGYGLLSGYKGLFESVELIRDQAEDLIASNLGQFGSLSVNVYARYPESPQTTWDRLLGHRFPGYPSLVPVPQPTRPHRDGFFYMLLVLTILEGALIAALVYGAVAKTYFRP